MYTFAAGSGLGSDAGPAPGLGFFGPATERDLQNFQYQGFKFPSGSWELRKA